MDTNILKGDRMFLVCGTMVTATEDARMHEAKGGPVHGFKNGDDIIVVTKDRKDWEVLPKN